MAALFFFRKYKYQKLFKECLINMRYITFEIAKKLKEKDYPFNTSHHYDKDGNIIVALCDYDERCEYPMPEIHQVLKWLREEKKLHIAIDIWGETWGYDIISLTSKNSLHWTAYREDINSYEEAAIAGIEYILDNLI